MPIHHAVWRVGDQPAPLMSSRPSSEQQLEDMIVRNPRILSREWMLIGRQEVTLHGGLLTCWRFHLARLNEGDDVGDP